MVSYQTWTSIVFEVAKEKGAQFSGTDDGASVVEVAADVWNERGDELKTATASRARDVARQEVTVA